MGKIWDAGRVLFLKNSLTRALFVFFFLAHAETACIDTDGEGTVLKVKLDWGEE